MRGRGAWGSVCAVGVAGCLLGAQPAGAAPLTVGTYGTLTTFGASTEYEPSATEATEVEAVVQSVGAGDICKVAFAVAGVTVAEVLTSTDTNAKQQGSTASFLVPAHGKWEGIVTGSGCTTLERSYVTVDGGTGPTGPTGPTGSTGAEGREGAAGGGASTGTEGKVQTLTERVETATTDVHGDIWILAGILVGTFVGQQVLRKVWP